MAAPPGFITRMREERAQLAERLNKLDDFLGSKAFEVLNSEDAALLERQELLMVEYHDVLSLRIARAEAAWKAVDGVAAG